MPRGVPKSGRKTKSQRIGDRGENRVTECLKTFIDENRLLHDIILSNGDSTSQIDNIAVTSAGVFVIEVKNYCADIINCGVSWVYWNYYLGYNKYTFYNPILQNSTHTELIKDLFNDDIPVHSVIVFSRNNPLKFVEGTKPRNVINDITKLRPYIESFAGNLSDEIQDKLIGIIKAEKRTDVTLAEHIDNISKYIPKNNS